MEEKIKDFVKEKKVTTADLALYFYVAVTAMGVILYLNSTYATVEKFNKLKEEVKENKQVLCKIAIAVNAKVEEVCARYR